MKRRIFEKPGLGPRVFALFSKYDFQGSVEGGLGGFKYDFFDVMLDSIYDDILCMALTCNNYHDIYIMTTRAQLSEEIRHADIGQAERWPRRILLSFAPSAAAGWHGERPRTPYARNGA